MWQGSNWHCNPHIIIIIIIIIIIPNSVEMLPAPPRVLLTSDCALMLSAATSSHFANLVTYVEPFTFTDSGIVKPDAYHSPLVTNILLPSETSTRNCEYSYSKFAPGDYTLLYDTLWTCYWSCLYNITSVDDAVANLNAVQEETSRGFIRKSKFPHCFSSSLLYYIWGGGDITVL
jgi:hypothetical protein